MLTPEQENEKYNKPCPYNNSIMCVQYPDEDNACSCDPCDGCPNKPENT